jgi:hypothetical protein
MKEGESKSVPKPGKDFYVDRLTSIDEYIETLKHLLLNDVVNYHAYTVLFM